MRRTAFIYFHKDREKFQVNLYLKKHQLQVFVGRYPTLAEAILERNSTLETLYPKDPLLILEHTSTLRKLKGKNFLERLQNARKKAEKND